MIRVVANVLIAAFVQEPAAEELPVLRPGDVIEGSIEEIDPVVRSDTLDELSDAPVHGKTYRVERSEPGPFFIELRSHLFDTYLVLRSLDGEVLLEDNDGFLSTHSRIVVAATMSDSAVVDVCSLDGGTGPFQVRVGLGKPERLSPPEQLVAALADARESVEVREQFFGPDHHDTAIGLENLAGLLRDQGAYEKARPLYERALRIWETTLGPDHTDTAISLDNLAGLLHDQGAHEEARSLFERALRIWESTVGPEHPETATCLSQLAALLGDQGAYEEARSLFERALRIREVALGPDHPRTVAILNNLARVFQNQGAYEKARPLFERTLRVIEATFGPEHPTTANSLHNLATLLVFQGAYEEARPLMEQALRINEATLGPDHPTTASSLNNLAALLQIQGSYEKARSLFARAIRIQEVTIGPDHPETASSLLNLASLLHAQGAYEAARPLYERAIRNFETTLGPEHPSTAIGLGSLGTLLRDQGAYGDARTLYERALRICETTLGPEHPHTAVSLNNLALLLENQGAYDRARPLYERALRIYEATLGPEHPETATSLNNLAALFQIQGAYEDARPLLDRALRITEATLGPDHTSTAISLDNLAQLLQNQGAHEDAQPLMERALQIWKATLGPNHPDTATSLNNLAGLLAHQGAYEDAQPLFEQALRIREETLGPDHPDTAISLDTLALSMTRQGAYEEARPLYARALRILEATLGPDHPETATCVCNLAVLLGTQGAYEKARLLFERALRIRGMVLGPDHTSTANSLNNLALLEFELGEVEAALVRSRAALESSKSYVERVLWSMSEAERLRLIRTVERHREVLLSLARATESVASRRESYETVLGWKGQVARSLLRTGLREVRSLPKAERAVVNRLRAMQTRLSDALYATEIANPDGHARQLRELRAQQNELEVDLARMRGRGGERAEGPRLDALAAALPEDAVAVDFLVHDWYEPAQWKDGALARKGRWTEAHLSAWVVRGGQPLRQFDLGVAAVVEEAVSGFLEEMVLHRGVAPAVADPSGPTAKNDRLRALLWEPLAEAVGDARMVFLSGDSFLGTLPFETLRREDGSFLIEHHAFAYLSDMQSLVDLLSTRARIEPQLLVAGGIDFRKRADVPEDASQLIASGDVRGGLMNRWTPLSGTSVEADAIADLYDEATDGEGNALLLKSVDATEEAIKRSIAGKTHVHFATHGYFQPEGLPSAWKNIKEQNDAAFTLLRETEQSVAGYLPGLLSGLVLAGANLDHEPGRDNGLLTAEEVTYLDLKFCDLVVLSACETGLGRPEGGEGMIGLRRAFRMAGARTVISSLWRTGDQSTQRLMTDFYENLWLRGMSKLDALRGAQLAMLKRNREEYGRAIPATWGVFVLDGAPN